MKTGPMRLMCVGALDDAHDFVERMLRAASAGLDYLQIRDRSASEDALRSAVTKLKYGAPQLKILINSPDDRAEIARSIGVGLHLPEQAGRPDYLPPDIIWGRSVHSLDAALSAEREGAKYVVLGTIFPTPSHPDHPGAGVALVSEVCRALSIPVFAIGGIEIEHLARVIEAGVAGVALRRPFLPPFDPEETVRRFIDISPTAK